MKNMKKHVFAVMILTLFSLGCVASGNPGVSEPAGDTMPSKDKLKHATFAGGCFWCTEAIFQELKGVYKVTSGYIGGNVANPTYEQVCSGTTGHAEAVDIVYNPDEITYEELLEVFFKTHDPTTLNRQGADEGTQYRSEVFYHDEGQKEAAQGVARALDQAHVYADPIVTKFSKASTFYSAEKYHQDYYANNGRQGYCRMVITPKVEKFRKVFADKIRQAKVKH